MIESQIRDWTSLARCWGKNVPNEVLISGAVATVRRKLPAKQSLLPSLTTVIEVRIITGPRIVYGLLGAIYKPSDGTELVLEFPVCPAMAPYTSSLPHNEHPIVGLPEWLVSGIADAASDYAAKSSPQSGTISFCYAAYSQIGSNVSIFKALMKCVLDALLSGIEISTREQLASVVQKQLGG